MENSRVNDYAEIIKMSGIELLAVDQIGNSFPLSPSDIAIVFSILDKNNITRNEKAMMIYGAIQSPVLQKKEQED